MDDADYTQQQAELAEAMLAKAAARKAQTLRGMAECVECDEPISELRQNLGAIRCVPCQTLVERLNRRQR